ncbi:hypothetical protein ABZ023_27255 [Streptomyces sp. NPDC006367]
MAGAGAADVAPRHPDRRAGGSRAHGPGVEFTDGEHSDIEL